MIYNVSWIKKLASSSMQIIASEGDGRVDKHKYLYGIDNGKYILEDDGGVIKRHNTKYPGDPQDWNYSTECLRA